MKDGFMKRYGNFLWHGSFLALTMAFVEINTVIPSLILKAGGGSFSVGLVSAILTGIPLIAQLLFAGFLISKPRKKPYLIFAIYLRIISLAALGFILGSSFEGITPAYRYFYRFEYIFFQWRFCRNKLHRSAWKNS